MITVHKPSSHIDHLMRATQFHHVQLSAMADVKANMLLTMSSVVLTLSLPQVLKGEHQHLWPFYILIGSCLLTICLAAYAVMPKLPPANLPPPDVYSPNFNVLFFGDFTRISQEEYLNRMAELMNDHSQGYEAQAREVYLLGQFLAKKKYRFLRYGYLSFVTGLFATLVAFGISMILK